MLCIENIPWFVLYPNHNHQLLLRLVVPRAKILFNFFANSEVHELICACVFVHTLFCFTKLKLDSDIY